MNVIEQMYEIQAHRDTGTTFNAKCKYFTYYCDSNRKREK